MKINYTNNAIELTKNEATQASKPNSPMYDELKKWRQEFPSYKVVVINAPKKKAAKNSKINYEDMERYISFHDDEDHSKMREFNSLRHAKENGALTSKNFFQVKKWFFEVFPDAA